MPAGRPRLRAFVASGFVGLASLVLVSSSVDAAADAGTPAPALPACVVVSTEARWVPYGYNHIVTLKNGCSKAATCSVSTDISPQATSIDVAASATVDVLTFTASPAQTFFARVGCKLR